MPRIETGVVRFGKDWPGVFIRGDKCMEYAIVLNHLIPALSTVATDLLLEVEFIEDLKELQALLASSHIQSESDKQLLIPFENCKI